MNFSKENLQKALIRAIRTFAQTAASMFTVGMAVKDIDWVNVLSVAAVAALYSLLMSIAGGLPESSSDGTLYIHDGQEGVQRMLFSIESDPDVWQKKDSVRLKVNFGGELPEGLAFIPSDPDDDE